MNPSAPLPTTTPAGGRRSEPTEVLGLVVFFALNLIVAAKLVAHFQLSALAGILAAALVGYVGADFVSGIVHWAFDTWGSPSTPVLGKTFIIPFRVHHTDPKDITVHGFVPTNGHNCLIASLPLAGALLVSVGPEHPLGLPIITFWLSLCLGVFGTNQFHKWAHADEVSPVVDRLQRMHLILPKVHHSVHHSHPYEHHYCITTGWLNEPLRAIRFFRAVEWVIQKVTGVVPRKDDLAPGQTQG
jgi:plasmanylethanolamine desaturase